MIDPLLIIYTPLIKYLVALPLGIFTVQKGAFMTILVDADACPVKEIIERIGSEFKIPITMFIDTSHILTSNYSKIVTVGQDPDAVDLALINQSKKGDIIVTQDYGVASLALGKGAFAIHQNGMEYTLSNIDQLLFERHLSKKQRKHGHRTGHAKKRTIDDNIRFEQAFRDLCVRNLH